MYFDSHNNLTNFCFIYLSFIQLLVFSDGFLFYLLEILQSNETSEHNIDIFKKSGNNELGGF